MRETPSTVPNRNTLTVVDGTSKGPRSRTWLAYLLVGLLATGIYFLLPSTGAQNVLYDLIGVSALIAVLVGVRVHRPIRWLPWYAFASGLLMFALGDLIWTYYENVLGVESPFPSVADVLYLAAPLYLAAGLWLMIYERDSEHRWASLIDALIAAVAAAMLLWIFLVDPHTHNSSHSLLELLLATSYSLADVALLMMALRMGFLLREASAAFYLLAAGLVLMAISHTIYTEALLSGTYKTGDTLASGWMLAYVLFGAAALHPSMSTMSGFASSTAARPTWDRPVMLAGITLLAPAVLVYQAIFDDHIDVAVVAGGSVALFVLVAIRMVRVSGQRERAEEELRQQKNLYEGMLKAQSDLGEGFVVIEDQRILFANEAFCEISGYTLRELRAVPSFMQLLPEEEGASVMERRRRRLSTGEGETHYDTVLLTKEGRHVGVELALKASELDGHSRYAIIVRDLTERKAAEEARSRLASIVENSTDAIDSKMLDGTIVTLNPSAEKLYGYSTEEIKGDNVSILTPPDRIEEMKEMLERVGRGETVSEYETERVSKDGRRIPLSLTIAAVRDQAGNIVGASAIARDISERKQGEEALQVSEEKYRTIVDTANEGVWLLDPRAKTTYVNRRMTEMIGYAKEEMLDRSLFDFMDDEAREEAQRNLERRQQGIKEDHDFRFRHKDGSDLWAIVSTSPWLDASGNYLGALGMLTDITERKRIEEQLAHQALHDPLTDLPNRALFMDRLDHALARATRNKEPVEVLVMDLDNFKVVNDSLGHQAGDRLLVSVAERLRTCLRTNDTVARFSGDEFAILVEGTLGAGYPVRVAERIAQELQAPFVVEGQEVFVNTTIGIALSGTSSIAGDSPEKLMRKADIAMYEAKRKGKSRYAFFEEAMNYGALERLHLERDLRRALKLEQFRVHYQPKVSLEDDTIVGFEALVRWEHPERGLVPPAQFIPLAEETDLIVPIGQWVLGEACRQGKEWQRHYPSEPPLMMSVNLSARQFEHPELAEDIARVLEKTGVDPCSLNLEITETVAMGDAPQAARIMRELKALGVKISIDDFGTGFSSMSYLQQFPADYLKIDCSFVSRLGESPEDMALVTGIVGLAHTLGMRTVAEGVESADQLAKVREVGCDLAQGYHFSKPLLSKEAAVLLESWMSR